MKVSGEAFGAAVASALGAGPGRSSLAAQRNEVMRAAERLARRGRAWRWYFWVPAFAGAVILLATLAWRGERAELTATWRGKDVVRHALLESIGASSGSVSFSDGSALTLEAATRVRVDELLPGNVVLELERGRVEAHVAKRAGQRWSIQAGPYTVQVIGTRFTVEWERAKSSFTVAVSEGSVSVSGADAGNGVVLGPGARFTRSDAASSQPARATSSSAPPLLVPSAAPRDNATAAAPSGASGPGVWSSLAAKGKYKEALTLAEKHGFDELCESAPERELLLLANTARYAGAPGRATQALLRLRQRFPGRAAASLSAFYLARVAEDSQRDLPEAARWLRIFLSEAPHGDLAASARASLLGILLRTGDRAGAQRAAQQYLEHHPDGPHAKDARAVLDRQRQ